MLFSNKIYEKSVVIENNDKVFNDGKIFSRIRDIKNFSKRIVPSHYHVYILSTIQYTQNAVKISYTHQFFTAVWTCKEIMS